MRNIHNFVPFILYSNNDFITYNEKFKNKDEFYK